MAPNRRPKRLAALGAVGRDLAEIVGKDTLPALLSRALAVVTAITALGVVDVGIDMSLEAMDGGFALELDPTGLPRRPY